MEESVYSISKIIQVIPLPQFVREHSITTARSSIFSISKIIQAILLPQIVREHSITTARTSATIPLFS